MTSTVFELAEECLKLDERGAEIKQVLVTLANKIEPRIASCLEVWRIPTGEIWASFETNGREPDWYNYSIDVLADPEPMLAEKRRIIEQKERYRLVQEAANLVAKEERDCKEYERLKLKYEGVLNNTSTTRN